MTQKELVKAVTTNVNAAGKVKVTEAATGEVLKGFVAVTTETLKKGDSVQLAGFGAFKPVHKEAREGRNPSTGETIKIPARVAPKFKASKTLKEALN